MVSIRPWYVPYCPDTTDLLKDKFEYTKILIKNDLIILGVRKYKKKVYGNNSKR